MHRRIILVGPSGSGKSTLADQLSARLFLPRVTMDDFRVKQNRNPPMVLHQGKPIRSYENPCQWDEHAIACKLRALIASGHGFIAEGNHLLMYPKIAEIPDTERFYLDVDFATSVERRARRNRGTLADQSFALIGDGETARYVAPQKAMSGVAVLDGKLPIAELLSAVMAREGVVA